MKQDKGDAGRAETSAEDESFFAHLREQGDMLRHRTAEVEGIRRYCNQIAELFANRGVLLAGPFLPLAELGKRELSPEQKERVLSLTFDALRLYMLGERALREIRKIAAELGNREPGIEITFALFGETLKYGTITTSAVALYYKAKALCEELGDTQAGEALAQSLAALLAGQAALTAKLDTIQTHTAGVPAMVEREQIDSASEQHKLLAQAELLGLQPEGLKLVTLWYRVGGNVSEIARQMQLSRQTVYNMKAAVRARYREQGLPDPFVRLPSRREAERQRQEDARDRQAGGAERGMGDAWHSEQ